MKISLFAGNSGEIARFIQENSGMKMKEFGEAIHKSVPSIEKYNNGSTNYSVIVFLSMVYAAQFRLVVESKGYEDIVDPVSQGDLFREIRNARKMTQSQFAESIGTTTSSYGMYEINQQGCKFSLFCHLLKTHRLNAYIEDRDSGI